MPASVNLKRTADDLIEIAVLSQPDAHSLAAYLRAKPVFIDTVAGYQSVCVRFDPADYPAALDLINAAQNISSAPTTPLETLTIPVTYGSEYGPDLERICVEMNLTPDAFIALHTSLLHQVDMLGFTPGFAYMSGLPETISVPRLSTPRPRVAAGSIGISRQQTGVYAMAGPGGWPIIGRTNLPLFDPEAATPFKLTPRQKIKFEAVSC